MTLPVSEPGRLRTIVLLTDGYIGNETQILSEVQQRMQRSDRLFSFGAGSSVNRYLLNRVAEIGRGVCRVVRQDEPTEKVAEKFFRQINNPVLTNIQLHWQGDGEPPIFYKALGRGFSRKTSPIFWWRCEGQYALVGGEGRSL